MTHYYQVSTADSGVCVENYTPLQLQNLIIMNKETITYICKTFQTKYPGWMGPSYCCLYNSDESSLSAEQYIQKYQNWLNDLDIQIIQLFNPSQSV
jgi:hypothetical protein